jgi:hypothetical protein
VEPAPSDWKRFARPGFLLEFGYPDPTPNGQAVERDEDPFRSYARVHLSSPDRSELYFEVVRFGARAPEDEYLEHRPHLEGRFGTDSVTALTETRLLGRPAWAYSFRWDEEGRPMERAVLMLQVAGETYRIIYDPRSPLNDRVIATLAVAG